ncbi:MAG: transglycosylase SLT domain-containing protein [Bacteroidetes bacterium]|jgi:membrane-bound lytic murein transglycosylase D|nr:transglycosylase SLT domain-containing protein [Bacteroidota bacterium]
MPIKKILFLIAGLLPLSSIGQGLSDVNSLKPGDPIVNTLDSLLSIRNVVRISESDLLTPEPAAENKAVFSNEFIQTNIAKISTPIPLTFNNQVKRYIELYASQRVQLTSRVLGLSNLYFPLFEQMLDKYNIPVEFKYLSIVESALNPIAVSSAGATGIWQFMFNTGKVYGLNINSYIDERRDVMKATDAACRYFKEMYDIYGDWLLVVASYNCGPGNVNRAIARAGGSKNFWEISRFLPAETRGYVPAFIAATYVMHYAKDYKIYPAAPAFTFNDIDTVGVKSKVSLRQLSEALSIPYDVISFLNPIYKRGVVPGEGFTLNLPSGKISQYIANEEMLYAESNKVLAPFSVALADDADYVQVKRQVKVKKGESIFAFAQRNDCSASQVKKWNKLKSNHIVAGRSLIVMATVKQTPAKNVTQENIAATENKLQTDKKDSSISADSTDETITISDAGNNAVNVRSQIKNHPDYIYHLVQPGDTLWNIAKRYDGVTVETLKEANNFNSNYTLKVGAKIKVPAS